MVSAESAQIILADTVYTEEEQIFEDLDRLGTTITNKSIDSNRDVTADVIREQIDRRKYIEAKNSLDLYIRKYDLDSTAQAFWDEIIPYLTNEYYKQAEKQRRSKNYSRAKEYINLAISLRIEEKYFQLRDRIYLEEELYIKDKKEREELARLRNEEQQLREREYVGVNPIEEYYWGIKPQGMHLGISNQWFLPDDLTLPTDFGNWGADFLLTHAFHRVILCCQDSMFISIKGGIIIAHLKKTFQRGLKFSGRMVTGHQLLERCILHRHISMWDLMRWFYVNRMV